MNLRIMATAFIINGSRILMLKRSNDRKLAPGLWTGVGGHFEPSDLDNPRIACLREVNEETGIKENELSNIELRYMLLRKKGNEIRQQFVYFCHTQKHEVINTYEGELHWIEFNEIEKLRRPRIIEFMFKHYFECDDKENVYVGTMVEELSIPAIHWIKLTDPGNV